jgi:small nuclear ribonucleoprotein (snRNP)-like protein
MNIALENCTEHVDGARRRSYGDAFIRGNNGWFLFPSLSWLLLFLLAGFGW